MFKNKGIHRKEEHQTIDRQFAAIADDQTYQVLNEKIAESFKDSDWEALSIGEGEIGVLDKQDQLVKAALAARERAYAPYSNYAVGAAVLAADGQIFTGVNVENASYGLSICAERTAVFRMIATTGHQLIQAVAVATANGGSPCGACRQVLVEFAPQDIPLWLTDAAGNVQTFTLHQLLPAHFGPERLT
jgi:cytidine deaminase